MKKLKQIKMNTENNNIRKKQKSKQQVTTYCFGHDHLTSHAYTVCLFQTCNTKQTK